MVSTTSASEPCTRRGPARPGGLLFLAVLLALPGALESRAAQPSPAESIAALTAELTSLHLRYRLASAPRRGQSRRRARRRAAALLERLLGVAATRQQLLAALAEDDPAEALRLAMPASQRAALPAAVQARIEQEAEAEGEVEVRVEDHTRTSRVLYSLETAGERFSLHFAADPPMLATGSRLGVRGVRIGSALALASGSSGSTEVQALTVPNTFGAQRTLVILVNFQDRAVQPYTVAQAQGVVFTSTSDFDRENSQQQTWLTGDVYGWFTVPMSYTACDPDTLASQARTAASAAGAVLSNYTRFVYAFPDNACSWWGLGTVGGNPSHAWVNGSFALQVVAHEMGHNLGLYHSHALDCGSVTLGTSCTSFEYGDTLDVMGSSADHFNAFQKERIGWLGTGSSPPVTTVLADGTYAIDPYELAGTNPKALKILKAVDPTTGYRTWYYVEYRQAVGFDASLAGNANVLGGVVVHTGSESSGGTSYLLDMTPATASWLDPALTVGQAFYDPASGVSINPVSASSGGALVAVSFGALPCVHAAPAVALSPAESQWVTAGTPVTYTVSVTNNDNAGCTASSFGVQAAVPSGWAVTTSAPSLSLAPGASASTTVTVTSAPAAAEGFYSIRVTATNASAPAYLSTATGTYVVASTLGVAVTTDRPSYSKNQWVSVAARVSALGSPATGVSVAFSVTKPGGTVVRGTATTGSDGAAVFRFRLRRTDPSGIYQATAAATLGGLSGVGATTFTVQ